MQIITPTQIETVAWEGEFPLPAPTFSMGQPASLLVTLGKPEIWTIGKDFEFETGKKWSPPIGNAKFWLVRFACTLREPIGRTNIVEASQNLYIQPIPHSAGTENAYAHNLMPQRLGVEDKSIFTVSLGPELGFVNGSSIKVGEVGLSIEYRKVFPVIQSFGVGEANPYWVFRPHVANPLVGSQFVYAVLTARNPAIGLRVHIEFTVITQTALGPVKIGLPSEISRQIEFEIE